MKIATPGRDEHVQDALTPGHGKPIAFWSANRVWRLPLIVGAVSFHAFILLIMDKGLA